MNMEGLIRDICDLVSSIEYIVQRPFDVTLSSVRERYDVSLSQLAAEMSVANNILQIDLFLHHT